MVQVRNYFSAFAAGGILTLGFQSPEIALVYFLPGALILIFALTILAERKNRRHLLMEMFRLRDTTEKLSEEMRRVKNSSPMPGEKDVPLPKFSLDSYACDETARENVISLRGRC